MSIRSIWSQYLILCSLIILLLACQIQAKDECASPYWNPGQFERRAVDSSSILSGTATKVSSSAVAEPTFNFTNPVIISPIISNGTTSIGEVNCRYTTNSDDYDINYYTCTEMADKYKISVETFFTLNPDLKNDCGKMKAGTDYCVRGFIEPPRAIAGLCGPPNGNKTCLGTLTQCCNANTFTCGNSTADCADGTCFEGACAGDSVYTTNGKCGRQNGYKQCAGVWGDCCNAGGKCGTGPSFCGYGVCQLGNCTVPATPPSPPAWLTGNTTDGTCGGTKRYTCNVVYGNCCNKDGQCGSLPTDCGTGCQPLFGSCASGTSSTTTSSKAVSSQTTSRSSVTSPVVTSKTTPVVTTTSKTTTKISTLSPTTSPKPQTTSILSPTTIKPSTTPVKTTTTTRPPSTTIPGLAALPSCGQTCFNNMLAQYSALGCPAVDSYCLCNNVNFANGIRDCSNGACGSVVASTVISFGSAYCSTAFATHTATTTGFAALPSCGQTCFNNMVAQYSALGCASPQPSCLCKNANFGYGLRDCANGACGTAVAPTVTSYGSAYCASATAA